MIASISRKPVVTYAFLDALLSFFISRDFFLAAVLGWITFFLAALSSVLIASITAGSASLVFLAAISFSALATEPLVPVLMDLLRTAFLAADLADFSAVFALGNSAYLLRFQEL